MRTFIEIQQEEHSAQANVLSTFMKTTDVESTQHLQTVKEIKVIYDKDEEV